MDAITSRDAIVVEIVRSALNNISAEMGTAVCRGGYSTSIKEGGDQIEYEDQDPRIHREWLEEMRKNDVTPKMDKFKVAC